MIVPNSYQKPNYLTDQVMWLLTGDEWKTLDYALRRTFGFNRERDRISISQFMNGNGKTDDAGRPYEYGTGLSRGAVIDALNELMRFGILVEVAPNNSAKQGRLWELQLDGARVRIDLMLERHEARVERGRAKTAAARAKTAATRQATQPARVADGIGLSHRPVGENRSVCPTDRYRFVPQTGIGLSHRPVSVCPTDPQKHSKKPSGNTEETHSEGEAAGATQAWRELVKLCEGNETKAAAVWRLQERFAAATKLKRPDPATADGLKKLAGEWWPHLRQVLADADGDLQAAETAVQEAVDSMTRREKPLHVVGPRSIVNVAAGVLARQRRGDGAAPALAQRPKGMAGIDAYAKRRGMTHDN